MISAFSHTMLFDICQIDNRSDEEEEWEDEPDAEDTKNDDEEQVAALPASSGISWPSSSTARPAKRSEELLSCKVS